MTLMESIKKAAEDIELGGKIEAYGEVLDWLDAELRASLAAEDELGEGPTPDALQADLKKKALQWDGLGHARHWVGNQLTIMQCKEQLRADES